MQNVKMYFLFVLLLIAGCASGLQTDAQRVFQIEQNYKAALAIAVAYKGLPECPSTLVCKKSSVVKDLQDADDVAYPGLQSAQACVRSKTCTHSALAVNAANTAVAALTAVTARLTVKEKE